MDQATFRTVVDTAKYAPSAHNTQPARWTLQGDGSILISADPSRRLTVGDPQDRDLQIACGAAVEGTVLALAQIGHGAQVVYLSGPDDGGYRPMATVSLTGDPVPEDVALAGYVTRRRTHRLGFAAGAGAPLPAQSGVTVVTDQSDIAWLSTQIDVASARIMQDRAFRSELLDWMRLSPKHALYHRDGLNKAALAMDWLTATLTRPILGSPLYTVFSAMGLGPALSGEAAKSRTSAAIILLHWSRVGDMRDAGRCFYRSWLEATSAGLAGWPAAALADDEHTAQQIKDRFAVPQDQVLFNALRVGAIESATPDNTRLDTDDVIV